MGCSPSSRGTGEQPQSKNLKHRTGANRQAKKNASFTCQSQSVVEDSFSERRLPDDTDTLPSPEEANSEKNTVIRSELAKKPMGFIERERQTSEDILEELRTQGIIKTASGTTQNRQREDTLSTTTGRPPQKPPAKLEKLESKRKKENNLMIEDIESKTREKKLKQDLLIDRPSPIIKHASRTTRSVIDNETSEVLTISSNCQLLSLNLDPRSLMQEEEVDEYYSFKDFDVVESDMTYNTVNGTF